MMRTISAAAFLAAAIVIPAQAQETQKIDPSTAGPTKSVTDQVPTMKGESTTNPTKSMDSATPTMKQGNSASRQAFMLDDQAAKNWIGKPIYSSDQKKVGEVLSFVRSPDNSVTELHAGLGGLLGLGETQVIATPSQFSLGEDRVVLNLTAADANNLPKVKPTR